MGKSNTAQENVVISANADITMDIIPLHGEVQVTTPIEEVTCCTPEGVNPSRPRVST